MTDVETAAIVAALHEAVRQAQTAGDHQRARQTLLAIQKLDPGNELAVSLLDGSARHCQMTLMFCDLVGSTGLAERLHPEAMAAVLRAYRTACAEIVERYEGFIEDRQGDGLLIRFGSPRVHEDDPRRAVLAALEIVEAVREQDAQSDVTLAVRIAVHTGMVLIDAGDIVGTTPNEAARLQSLAEPNTVLISDVTHAIVAAHFDCDKHAPAVLKGVSRPVTTHTVRSERAGDPLEAASWLTPFVGRRAELDAIAALWRQARAGASPRGLLVSGPPGIGKSRLLAEASRELGATSEACQCSRYHTATSLHAFRRLLRKVCEIEDADEPGVRLAKLRARAGAGTGDLPLLAAALDIPLELTSPPQDVDPSLLRVTAIHAAAALFMQHHGDGPWLLVVEDVQWADDSTLDLILALLGGSRPDVLVALTAREEFAPPWPDGLVERLVVGGLADDELQTMALEIPESAPLSDDDRRELVKASDGIPLYLEELAREVEARPWRPRPRDAAAPRVPATLHDRLLAQLSAPGVDMELAQIAATIGRDVDQELLRRAAGMDEDVFHAKLANLLTVGVLDRATASTLRFRHALIRREAYDTQLSSAKRTHHSRVADLLDATAVRLADAGALAYHLDRAERLDEAIQAYIAAATRGQELGTHKEATQQLTRALQLLERLPGDPVRELGVRQLRAYSAVMAWGYSCRECQEDHDRCVALCAELGLGPALLPSLLASWGYYCSCDLRAADRVLHAAEEAQSRSEADIPVRQAVRGVNAFFEGRFAEACELLLAFVDHPWGLRAGGPPEEWLLPHDVNVAACAHLAAALWIAGEPRAARAVADRGAARAKQLGYPHGPFSTAYVNSQRALIHRLEGDHAEASALGARMTEAFERHGFGIFALIGAFQQGLTRVLDGDLAALDALTATVAAWRKDLAADVWCPYLLAELAAAQAGAGRRPEAYASLKDAMDYVEVTGADFYTAEVLRIRGELRCEDGDPGGLADLQAAVDKARDQGAEAFLRRAEESQRAARELAPS